MQMNVGQVPVMFFEPDAPVNDVRANTMPSDADMATMLPAEMPTAEGILTDPRTWFFVGAALVIWWAWVPRRT